MGIPEEDVKVGLDAFLESLVFWNLSLAAKKTLEKGEKTQKMVLVLDNLKRNAMAECPLLILNVMFSPI